MLQFKAVEQLKVFVNVKVTSQISLIGLVHWFNLMVIEMAQNEENQLNINIVSCLELFH